MGTNNHGLHNADDGSEKQPGRKRNTSNPKKNTSNEEQDSQLEKRSGMNFGIPGKGTKNNPLARSNEPQYTDKGAARQEALSAARKAINSTKKSGE